ncbi:MAG: AzlC family ABC transporter permease [Pseudomonadota bacterium]
MTDQVYGAPSGGRSFLAGMLAALPLQIATVPFGVIFGALAIEAGLSLFETMAMTSIVVAGAAQLVALQMLVDEAPALLIVLTAAFVNLRMAIYSAALAMHWPTVGPWPRVLAAWFLNDQSYALSIRRYEDRNEPEPQKVRFFFGVGVCCLTCWIGSSIAGAALGAHIPENWPTEFAIPVVFIALVAPWLGSAPNIAVAVLSGGVSLALVNLDGGVIVALIVGIGLGLVLSGHET